MLRSEACNILKRNLKDYQASSSSNVWDEPTTTASLLDTSNTYTNTKRLRYKSSLYYYKRLNCKDFITGDPVNIDSAEEAIKEDRGDNPFSLSKIIPTNFEMPFISSENKHKDTDNTVNEGHNSDSSLPSKKSETSSEHKLKKCIQWYQKYTESDSSSTNKLSNKSSHTDTDTITTDSSTTTDTGADTSVGNREEDSSQTPLSRLIPINKSYADINLMFISFDPQVRGSGLNRQLAQNMPPKMFK